MLHFLAEYKYIVAALASFYLLSGLVDALPSLAPKPTDGRLYVFIYALVSAIAGNLVTALRALLHAFYGKQVKDLNV